MLSFPRNSRARQAGQPIYYGWVVVGACFVVISLASPLIASFSVFYVAVLGEFHWSRAQLSTALAIHLVVCGLAAPFTGGLIDRFGPRRVMPIGAAIAATALMALSQATALWHFYIGFGVFAAIGSSLLHIVPLTTIVSNWFVQNRGTAIGIVTGGSGAGQFLMLPLLHHSIEHIGWRGSYFGLGLAILIIPTVLIRRYVYSRPEDRGLTLETAPAEAKPTSAAREVMILDQDWASTEWTLAKAARSFRFWALTLVMALFAAGLFLIYVQLVAYLIDKGYAPVLAASVVGTQGLLNVVGKFAGGMLCDRIGRERTLTISISIFVASIALLYASGMLVSPVLVYLFTVFYGMGYGMALPALMTSAADLFQGRHFGAVLGVIVLGGFLGGSVGTWLGGALYDLTKDYQLNFLLASLAMLLAAVLIWKARPGKVRVVRLIPAARATVP